MLITRSMNSFLTIAATTLGLALLAPTAQAALISGVTASATMGALIGTRLSNTLSGAGLPSNTPALSGNHAAVGGGNAWLSTLGLRTGTITFNLGASYNLSGFSFWNFNSANHNLGIRGVTVQSSTDGVSFSTVLGAPTEFARGIDGSMPPEVFSFSPVTTSYVRFVVASNWGNTNYTGFSEVQFDAAAPAAVPEPTGIVGLLAVGGVFLTTKRRRA